HTLGGVSTGGVSSGVVLWGDDDNGVVVVACWMMAIALASQGFQALSLKPRYCDGTDSNGVAIMGWWCHTGGVSSGVVLWGGGGEGAIGRIGGAMKSPPRSS
ncbi:MAG: hypothetical protein HC795_13030, partial [Coleofasciculaceae cyanobacterium RL_1_1]|nr:hypothetical protein [Coleofasciculaceae cyanobacterium RL_1_1]